MVSLAETSLKFLQENGYVVVVYHVNCNHCSNLTWVVEEILFVSKSSKSTKIFLPIHHSTDRISN